MCSLNHTPMRHAARGNYRQRIRACHPKQVMADKSGRQHFGNPHDILARYACTDSRQTASKSYAALARDRTRDLLHASRPLCRPRHEISKFLFIMIFLIVNQQWIDNFKFLITQAYYFALSKTIFEKNTKNEK